MNGEQMRPFGGINVDSFCQYNMFITLSLTSPL